jgi:hypothetical protein
LSRAQKRAQERANRGAISRLKQQGAVDLKTAPNGQKLPLIAIGYAWSEKRGVSGFWHKSVVRLLAGFSGKARFTELSVESGPFLSRARNTIVKAFLESEADYLLMTDTDAVFSPEDVSALIEADKPIAGALVYTAVTGSPVYAAIMLRNEETGKYEFAPSDFIEELPAPPETPEGMMELPESEQRAALENFNEELTIWREVERMTLQPRRVGALGCTLTLYRRDVVEAVQKVYEHPFEYLGEQGEDITFCDRAADEGFETWVVPEARIGHAVAVVL